LPKQDCHNDVSVGLDNNNFFLRNLFKQAVQAGLVWQHILERKMSATITFRQRILRAGSWTIGASVGSQLIRLASNLVMTRLLVPEMFGVMALANAIMAGMQLLSDLGLKQNIVQSHNGNAPAFLNTVWTIQIMRGGLIWLLMLGIAGAIYLTDAVHWWHVDSVYADPILPYVIVALSFNAMIGGLESTRLATASRNLALGRMYLLDLTCNLAGVFFMVSWAMVDRSIWALVYGTLFTSALRVLASHTLLPGIRNRLHWDKDSLHEIFNFGKWIFLTSILGFLAANGDRLLLGGLIDPATLGIYSIAFMMVSAIRDAFAVMGSNVAFPAFSEIVRSRKAALKQAYYRFRLPMDVATLVAAGMLFAAGHLLIQFLYDDRYLEAGHMLEILCIGLLEVRFSLAIQCFMALGIPKLMVPLILIRILALFGLMPIAFNLWGLDGALWIVGSSALFALPVTFYFKAKHDLFDLKRELIVLPLIGVVF
jgi:O-antigen/teichoic acid export membrane protein